MTEEQYWALVEIGPDNYTRNQRILFWWVVMLLPQMAEGGIIMTPDPSPLSVEQIARVFTDLAEVSGEKDNGEILLEDEDSWNGTKALIMGSQLFRANFKENKIVTWSSDGLKITLERDGTVSTQKA